ncbi:MAG TPA: YggT family protein, partial [Casimicrobiaceae bacterium]|nr:YggT family protein [Casimicrobiaceae bacterium]
GEGRGGAREGAGRDSRRRSLMLTDALRFLLNIVFGLLVYTVLLRFLMQVLRAPFRNPLGQAVAALTDWAVKPVRRILPGYRGYDWASLLLAWLFQVLWLAAMIALETGIVSGAVVGLVAVLAVVELIKAALWIAIVAVFVQAVLSWVAPDGPIAGVLNALTFPLLRPIRRVIPPLGGVLDLSPLIVIVIAQLVLIVPVAWLEQQVAQLFR